MDMSQFRKHLQEVEGKLVHPQASAMFEEKKNSGPSLEQSIRGVASGQLNEAHKLTAGKYGKGVKQEDAAAAAAAGGKKKKAIAEETFAGYLNDYFGGELNESTSENEILEAVQHLFEMEAVVAEYLEGDENSTPEEVYEAIDDYLYAYFGDELTEDLDEQSIADALLDLVETAEATRIVLED